MLLQFPKQSRHRRFPEEKSDLFNIIFIISWLLTVRPAFQMDFPLSGLSRYSMMKNVEMSPAMASQTRTPRQPSFFRVSSIFKIGQNYNLKQTFRFEL